MQFKSRFRNIADIRAQTDCKSTDYKLKEVAKMLLGNFKVGLPHSTTISQIRIRTLPE
jgi:hypothetical protein